MEEADFSTSSRRPLRRAQATALCDTSIPYTVESGVPTAIVSAIAPLPVPTSTTGGRLVRDGFQAQVNEWK